MSRLAGCLQALQVKQRKAVIPYIVAGDPWPQATVALMHAMVAAGANVIELGVPFSDPMAEGPVIQLAHERALAHNISLKNVLDMVQNFREKDDNTPVVLMGYANPVEVMGYELFASRAAKAGIDAVLTVDMPPEEAHDLNSELAKQQIDSIFLIAPTTTEQRVEKICAQASGYIYYVSLKGVTGAGNLDVAEVKKNVLLIKSKTSLPVCVGFGIKDAESAKAIAQCADGVVVGSVLVNALKLEAEALDVKKDTATSNTLLCQKISSLLSEITAGANG